MYDCTTGLANDIDAMFLIDITCRDVFDTNINFGMARHGEIERSIDTVA